MQAGGRPGWKAQSHLKAFSRTSSILLMIGRVHAGSVPGEHGLSRRMVYMIWVMKKEQLARRLAKECHVSPAAAADQLDRIVSDLLQRVRRGESASLPGLGTFQSGSQKEFHFDRDVSNAGGRSSKKRPK